MDTSLNTSATEAVDTLDGPTPPVQDFYNRGILGVYRANTCLGHETFIDDEGNSSTLQYFNEGEYAT
ncbi:MAG: hypothetical protein MJA29_05250, partial [Candidatus Omnitrophica bacterium]|nr:hypothetical protein [Candidatus Omnitrophota bacterium]